MHADTGGESTFGATANVAPLSTLRFVSNRYRYMFWSTIVPQIKFPSFTDPLYVG